MRYIFAIILTLAVCASGYAAQLKNSFVDGTLGVGTNTPATKLHVVGTVTATSATIGGVVSLLALDGKAFIDTNTNPGINAGVGTVTTNGIETIVTYNASSTFVVPEGVTSLKVLVVGGGAGGDGGVSSAVYGHGGGGGRVTYRSAFSVSEGSSHTVTIGTGGAAGPMDNGASPGVQSAFGSVTAAGGVQANNIGSGGDGGDSGNDIDSVVTNYNGLTDLTWGAAGGAGAGGVGGTVTDAAGGTGGAGYSSSITGTSTAYGRGGDGSGTGTGVPATVAANLGLGGHGHGTSPKAGGSGVVIIRFMTSYDMLSVNDRLRLDASGRLSVGGTAANNSLTVINHHVNGVGIDLRSDDTDLTGLNDFSVARLFADFTSGSYADSRLYLQTATGDNTWKTGLTIKDGKVGIETGTPTTTLHVIGTVTATGFVGNGSGLTAISHNNITGTGTNSHATIDSHLASSSNPHGATLTQTNATIAGIAAPYIAQTSGTGTGITLAGNTNLPSGIWNSSGSVGIGTTTPAYGLDVFGNAAFGTGNDRLTIDTSGSLADLVSQVYINDDLYVANTSQLVGKVGIGVVSQESKLSFGSAVTDGSQRIALYESGTNNFYGIGMALFTGGQYGVGIWANASPMTVSNPDMVIANGGNVGIGTTTPSNILTLPIGSPDDPIADAWTLYCLADYKDIGTETTEMIQISANDKIKTVPVSSFTKKALISDEEAEREVKQKYQGKIRESAKADLELYTTETGVSMRDNSYVDELLESMWETKADRLTLVEANKQKLIAEKKALPKFQRKNYGIVAEDAPAEAQVLREDGSLQGIDPYALVGILWANAQKQDERIALLETQIVALSARVNVLEGR